MARFILILAIMILITPKIFPPPEPAPLPEGVFEVDTMKIQIYKDDNTMCIYYRDSGIPQGCWELVERDIKKIDKLKDE